MYLIFMGVSGCGKSTYARLTSEAFELPYFEADDYHPEANVAKMSAGHALSDQDRVAWLENLCAAILESGAARAVVTCSALTPFVRATLDTNLPKSPVYLHLQAPEQLIRGRMETREGHFMPSSLLTSQFDALTVPDSAIQIANEGDIADVFDRIRPIVEVLLTRSEDERQ
ncbi:MAG: gluconokinase, GntK/IdnK-type [Hyphomonadaceae bacterium]|nr:gluconokinase, GntK/IdnK-type [Hyphomonadaceae bacterium]